MTYPANLTAQDIEEVQASARKRLAGTLNTVITAIGPKGLPDVRVKAGGTK